MAEGAEVPLADMDVAALSEADAESLVHAIPVWQFQLVYHMAGHATSANE